MNKKFVWTASSHRTFGFICSILIALAFSPKPAAAWNQVGHRAIAELVWRQTSPAQRKAASDLLRQHPHYQNLLAADVPRGVDRDEWVFLSAAVWPDWTRPAKKGERQKPESVTKYNLYPHAIGHPFLRAGETNRALLENFFIAKPNAEMVLSNSIATLKNKEASAHDRAVALCWTLHLIGDLHQPLHAANRVTREMPRGEGLGGEHFAKDARGKEVNLHAFWDQLPGVESGYKTIASLADRLQAAPELSLKNLKEYQDNKTIEAWVQESFRAAVDFAYAEDKVQFVHASQLNSKLKPGAPTLTPEYIVGAKEIANRRLVLAGRRATDVLASVW